MADAALQEPLPKTLDEFYEWHELQNERYEWVAGVPRMMAGVSRDHGTVALNIAAELRAALRGKPCRPRIANYAVRLDDLHSFFPDVAVSCSEEGEHHMKEPVVIIEVLSKSTEAHDRGDKWHHYRRIGSLRHFVLVAQNHLAIDHLHRKSAEDDWVHDVLQEEEGVLELDAIGVSLSVSDIYERVALEEPEPPRPIPKYGE